MFGDAALGETNLAMIATARSVGAAAKFTGSGGAVVVYCPEGEQQEQRLTGNYLSLIRGFE
jgi:glucuronokinase